MNHIIDSLLERLEIDGLKKSTDKQIRCLLSGVGCENLVGELTARLNPIIPKIFLNPLGQASMPDGQADSLLQPTLLEGDFEEKLSVFPPNTLDLIISLWTISISKPQETIKNIRQRLKKGGQFELITSLDGSPKVPFQIINRILKERPSIGFKLYRSALPDSLSALRKLLEKEGFLNSRVWPVSITRYYPDGNSVFESLISQSVHGLFDRKVSPSDRSFIKERFIELIEQHYLSNLPDLPRRVVGTATGQAGGAKTILGLLEPAPMDIGAGELQPSIVGSIPLKRNCHTIGVDFDLAGAVGIKQ